MKIRLQKFMSLAGVCSRRRGEKLIIEGRVSVNGKILDKLGTKVDPDKDLVKVDRRPAAIIDKKIYIALNKPQGYITSCRQHGKKLAIDLVNADFRVYPVGRLDKDSTGLLLLTNDGDLHLRLSHPSFNHEKEYRVTVAKLISDIDLERISKGIVIMGKKTRPARVRRIAEKCFNIVLKEGRNRQIRRMVQKIGNRVMALERTRISNIRLGGLEKGAWRYLTTKEKNILKEKKR